jgi:hypothetical protein
MLRPGPAQYWGIGHCPSRRAAPPRRGGAARAKPKPGERAASPRGRSQQQPAPPETSSAAQLAKSASRRVGRFSKQRFARLLRRGGADASGSGDGGDEDPLPLDARPFLAAVAAHLASKGADSSGGSGSGSGRGRGAKRGAARALLEEYVAVFGLALDLELQEEWEEAEQRLEVRGRTLACVQRGVAQAPEDRTRPLSSMGLPRAGS